MHFELSIMFSAETTPFVLLLLFYRYIRNLFDIMAEHALDWLREKAIGWSHTPPVNKIDTHHHFVPSFYAQGFIVSINNYDLY